jgi:hypothetical protein
MASNFTCLIGNAVNLSAQPFSQPKTDLHRNSTISKNLIRFVFQTYFVLPHAAYKDGISRGANGDRKHRFTHLALCEVSKD